MVAGQCNTVVMLFWALVAWRLPEFRENGQYRCGPRLARQYNLASQWRLACLATHAAPAPASQSHQSCWHMCTLLILLVDIPSAGRLESLCHRDSVRSGSNLAWIVALLMWLLVRGCAAQYCCSGCACCRMLLPRYWAAAEQLLPQASLTELSLLLGLGRRLGLRSKLSMEAQLLDSC